MPHCVRETLGLAAQLGVRVAAAGHRAIVVEVRNRRPAREFDGLAVDKVVQQRGRGADIIVRDRAHAQEGHHSRDNVTVMMGELGHCQ
jgi:hypothetical protein